MMTIILVTISVSEAFFFRNLAYRESKLLESYIIVFVHMPKPCPHISVLFCSWIE